MLNSWKIAGMVGLGALLLSVGMPSAKAQAVTLPTRTSLLPTTGTREIGLSGSLVFNGDNPYAISGTYGVFTSPVLEIGGIGTVSGAKHSSTISSFGAFADYYFRGANAIESNVQFIPYAGVFAGYSHHDDSSASLGAQIGGKYFFNPNVALTAEVQYRSVNHGGDNTQLLFGLSTFFR